MTPAQQYNPWKAQVARQAPGTRTPFEQALLAACESASTAAEVALTIYHTGEAIHINACSVGLNRLVRCGLVERESVGRAVFYRRIPQ